MNCKDCNVELTLENKVSHKNGNKIRTLPCCKDCRRIRNRRYKNVIIPPCLNCNQEITQKKRSVFCSDECRDAICYYCKGKSETNRRVCNKCKQNNDKKYREKTTTPICYGCKDPIIRDSHTTIEGFYCSDICKFNSKITKNENGCWEWNPGFDGNRRTVLVGFKQTNKVRISPKRFSVEYFAKKLIINSSHIIPKCDNKLCVNWEHLYIKYETIINSNIDEGKCTNCYCLLNSHTAITNKKNHKSVLNICKNCYSDKSKKKYCLQCKAELSIKKSDRKKLYCSMQCLLKFNYTITQDNCWEWIGSNDRGIPYTHWNNQKINPKYITYSQYHNKTVQRDYNIGLMPTCKKKNCINPEHLQLEKIRFKSIETSIILEIKEKYEKYSWSAFEISKNFKISPQIVWEILKGKRYQGILSSTDQMILNYDICKQCSTKHDNLGSEFCSSQCAQAYILK